jgi:RpiR family transcriptional regulator, carbohydrate utilization regulator
VGGKPLLAAGDGDDQLDGHPKTTNVRRDGVARGVASRARAHFQALAPAEVRVCEFVTANPEQVVRMSLQELAAGAGVSDATALRFCRAIGFSGFTEMKMALVADNALLVEAIFEEVTVEDSPWDVARKCLTASSQLIADTMELLDGASFDEAVRILDDAPSILIFAAGTSIPLAQDLETRLFRLGRNPVCVTDPFLQFMRAALVERDDAVVVISRSGAPPTILPAIREARSRHGNVVTITASAHSLLAGAADVVLVAASREIRSDAMASLVPMAAVTEALAVSLALRDQRVAIRNEREIWRAISPWRAT